MLLIKKLTLKDIFRNTYIFTHLVKLQLPLYNGRRGYVQSVSVTTLGANVLHHLVI